MTIPTDNPAGRLYSLLQKAAEAEGPSREKWRAAFGISADDYPSGEFETISNLVELVKLVDDVEAALLQVDEGSEVTPFLAVLTDIKDVLMRKSLRAVDAPFDRDEGINKHMLSLLGLASQLLSSRHLEPLVHEEDLAAIQVDVRHLFEEVKESHIDSDLRLYILNSLHQIDDAIQRFRIFGVKGLQDALMRITGELYYRKNEISDVSQNAATKTTIDRFTQIVGRLDSLTRFADTGMKVIGSAKSATSHLMALLGPGSGS
jgi:hypothetical protein